MPQLANNKIRKSNFIVFTIFIILAIIYAAKYLKHMPHSNMLMKEGGVWFIPEESPLRHLLKIQTVSYRKEPYRIDFSANLQTNPKNLVHIYSPLTGQINKIAVTMGDQVMQKEIIASIYSADLAEAHANWLKAKAALLLSKEQLVRIKAVQAVGASALKEVEMAEANYDQALAENNRSFLKLQLLGADSNIDNNGLLLIKAPFDGQVLDTFMGQGAFITDLTKPILSIAKVDNLWVSFCVREDLLQFIMVGQPLSILIEAYPNKQYTGNVLVVNPQIDPETRCNWVKAEIINQDGTLQPNMFAVVTVAIEKKPLILVPKSAILMDNEKQTVFVVDKPWHIKRQKVTTGIEYKRLVEVITGLAPTDQIVATGGIYINDQ
jgi:cobalt-zinc-cadmium efflux system membrane fusion protein